MGNALAHISEASISVCGILRTTRSRSVDTTNHSDRCYRHHFRCLENDKKNCDAHPSSTITLTILHLHQHLHTLSRRIARTTPLTQKRTTTTSIKMVALPLVVIDPSGHHRPWVQASAASAGSLSVLLNGTRTGSAATSTPSLQNPDASMSAFPDFDKIALYTMGGILGFILILVILVLYHLWGWASSQYDFTLHLKKRVEDLESKAAVFVAALNVGNEVTESVQPPEYAARPGAEEVNISVDTIQMVLADQVTNSAAQEVMSALSPAEVDISTQAVDHSTEAVDVTADSQIEGFEVEQDIEDKDDDCDELEKVQDGTELAFVASRHGEAHLVDECVHEHYAGVMSGRGGTDDFGDAGKCDM
ncbi:hypothetical protein SAICODRAFT_130758 [Saitoella complicata NRRL Y-17804]|uniref:uncharacterized protein n=1 Tax=Saitoella complicata (strain BCRC 22490 / CBS 7301 / JCM 7358 / NBRC 10748 / NRRL Y-17804) TaxID=698492 RepID=UPI0008679699|nr:uncharacterized protein SAICODRAFT_130758 [Saitoella complicata NRRL Y-17804]ODQ52560.1 hypothetical protein SAICODRAFT_130758 [Saitoella complicata NRRL Y-17804]